MPSCIFIISLEFPLQIKRDHATSVRNPWPKRPTTTAAHLVSLWQEVSLQLDKLHIHQQFIFGMKHKRMGAVERRRKRGIIPDTAPPAHKNLTPNLQGQGTDTEDRRYLTTNCSDVHRNSLSHLVYKDSER